MRRRFYNLPQDALNFEPLEDGFELNVLEDGKYFYYSIDGGSWVLSLDGRTPPINKGQILSIKSDNLISCSSLSVKFSKKFKVSGNILALSQAVLSFFFFGCQELVEVDENFLPFTNLTKNCYNSMFRNCINLINTPKLPATTLADKCYFAMFRGCTSLLEAPELPATTLASSCYDGMFFDCINLRHIKMLATDISADDCLLNWVKNVSTTGTFIKNPDAEWDVRGVSGVPEGWTIKFDGEEEGSNLITFYIGSDVYQAERGMTWGEWVDSEYNNGSFGIDFDNSIGYGVPPIFNKWVSYERSYVFASDIIQEGCEYFLSL